MATLKTISLIGSGVFALPADWNPNSNWVECWGPGGNGALGAKAAGGGGGAYSKRVNIGMEPGMIIQFQAPTGGQQKPTFFGTFCQADFGTNGNSFHKGTGGLAANGIGDIKYSGADAQDASVITDSITGGGGAAGPSGNGQTALSTNDGGAGDGGYAPGGVYDGVGQHGADGGVLERTGGGGAANLYAGKGGFAGGGGGAGTSTAGVGGDGLIVLSYYPASILSMANTIIAKPVSEAKQRVQIGVQSVLGTQVAATKLCKQLKSLNGHVVPETEEVRSEGAARPIDIKTNRFRFEASPDITPSYTEFDDMFKVIYGNPTITTVTAGVYQHLYQSPTYTQNNPVFLSLQKGSDIDGVINVKDVFGTGFDLDSTSMSISAKAKLEGNIVYVTDPGSGQTVAGQLPSEVISLSVTGTPTGGSLSLIMQFGVGPDINTGVYTATATIVYNSTAAQALTAINTALTNAGLPTTDENGNPNIAVSGGALPGTALSITFQNALARMKVITSVNYAGLTGGVSPAAAITETIAGGLSQGNNEVFTITISGTPTGGTWQINDGSVISSSLAYNATATQVQTALNAMWGANAVAVTGSAGGPYTVTCQNQMSNKNLAQYNGGRGILFINNLTGGTSPAITRAVTTTGGYTTDTFYPIFGKDAMVFLSQNAPITFDVNEIYNGGAPSSGIINETTRNIAQVDTKVSFDAQNKAVWSQAGVSTFAAVVGTEKSEKIEVTIYVSQEGTNPYLWVGVGQQVWMRLLFLSGGLDGAPVYIGGTNYRHAFWMDVPCKVSAAAPPAQVDGHACYKYTLTPNGDPQFVLQNGKASA